MKKLFPILLLVISYLLFPPKAHAIEPTCWCTGTNMENCTRYSSACPSGDAESYEGFSICCNDKNLYNSVFAIKSPICGSALEKPILGCELGTFADGNTMTFCVGNEFRRGPTDPIFDGKDNVNFDPGGSFTYNGNSYSSGNVYVCNSIASCCAQSSAGFTCKDIYTPNPYAPPGITDNNALPIDKRAGLCGLTGEPDDDLVRYVHSNYNEYELTCADTPVVDVIRETCETAAGGEGAPYGKVTQFEGTLEYIDVQALVSFVGAKLGGYGPDAVTSNRKNLDELAKIYPYNAILNLPLKEKAPREASGILFRLLNQLELMNAKAKLMLRYRQQTPPMRDQDIVYSGNESAQEGEADGAALADYMNAIISGVGSDPKIRLLSPAFNITSRFTPPLISKMVSSGANFSSLAGCAGNTYTVDGKGAHAWYTDFLAQTGLAGKCRGFVFTEFGDFDTFGKPLDGRPDVIARMKAEYDTTIADTSVMGAIYFNALGGNPEFTGHKLSPAEYASIVATNPAKGGVNSAKSFDNGAFQNEAATYMNSPGWTLEIAFSPGDADNVANSINTALSRGLTPVIRICVGTTCDFADPAKYVQFLKDVSSKTTGAFYAIAGPNEPEREQWVGSTPGETPGGAPPPPPKTVSLSNLMNRLPDCLKTYPICPEATNVYLALDPDTRIIYDALIPFNQDNLRGYLGLNYIEPIKRETDVGILTEGLSYVSAINEALNDSSSGIMRALSPGWINDRREGVLTGNRYITPREEKNNPGVIEAVANRAREIWRSDVTADQPDKNILGCFLHEKGVPLPAPTTYVKDFPVAPAKAEWEIQSEPFSKSLYQFLRVPVHTEEIQNSNKCQVKDRTGRILRNGTLYVTKITNPEGMRSGYDDRGGGRLVSDAGRAIAVLNNPKMTDISRLISEPKNNTNLSLNAMMLPSFAASEKPYENTPLLAAGGSYDSTIYYFTDPATFDSAKAGAANSTSGKIARKGGQAHIDLCQLRNFWLRPGAFQQGAPTECSEGVDILSTPPTEPGKTPLTIPAEANCNKNAPAGSPGSLLGVNSLIVTSFPSGSDPNNLKNCYNDVVSRSNTANIDPALTMAIWLEESAASWYKSYPNVADFGCTVNTPLMNFSSQISCFLGLKRSYSTSDTFRECRGSDNKLSLREFFLIYEGGFQSCRAGNFTIEPQFPARIQQYYSLVTGGDSLNFNQILNP